MAAINSGKCINTSMGFGPLNGLVMGTRSGDIDPSVIFHLINQLGYEPAQVNNLLNKRSGMLGLTGFSDMRDIAKANNEGNEDAALALDLYAYRVKKYIGAFAAILNGLDAIIFTAGVGENDAATRQRICTQLDYLGITINTKENYLLKKGIHDISAASSKVKVLVVPTNEVLEIARQCYGLLKEN